MENSERKTEIVSLIIRAGSLFLYDLEHLGLFKSGIILRFPLREVGLEITGKRERSWRLLKIKGQ